MADSVTVRQAVYSRLAGTSWSLTPAPAIVWSNTADSGQRPRIEVAPAVAVNRTITFGAAPGSTVHEAELALTVVVDAGRGEAESGPLVQDIQARFPAGTYIGDAVVTRRPDERPPLLDGSEYRVPVLVAYRAIL